MVKHINHHFKVIIDKELKEENDTIVRTEHTIQDFLPDYESEEEEEDETNGEPKLKMKTYRAIKASSSFYVKKNDNIYFKIMKKNLRSLMLIGNKCRICIGLNIKNEVSYAAGGVMYPLIHLNKHIEVYSFNEIEKGVNISDGNTLADLGFNFQSNE